MKHCWLCKKTCENWGVYIYNRTTKECEEISPGGNAGCEEEYTISVEKGLMTEEEKQNALSHIGCFNRIESNEPRKFESLNVNYSLKLYRT